MQKVKLGIFMAKKSKNAPEPRSQGRKIIGGIRSKLSAMNGTQLRAFYSGFTAKELERHEAAIEYTKSTRVAEEISEAKKEIEKLQEKIKSLKGK